MVLTVVKFDVSPRKGELIGKRRDQRLSTPELWVQKHEVSWECEISLVGGNQASVAA